MEVTFGPRSQRLNLPILFPDALIHADVSSAMADMLGTQFASEKMRAMVRPVSAGHLASFDLDTNCHGLSESLNKLKSRGKADDQLIKLNDYGAGHT